MSMSNEVEYICRTAFECEYPWANDWTGGSYANSHTNDSWLTWKRAWEVLREMMTP